MLDETPPPTPASAPLPGMRSHPPAQLQRTLSLQTARLIRDHVLLLMRCSSRLQLGGESKFLRWDGADFTAIQITAFTPMPQQRLRAQNHQEALLLQQAPKPKPYELSLWLHGKGKVLSVEWGHGDDLRVISFKRGKWEQRLLGLPHAPAE